MCCSFVFVKKFKELKTFINNTGMVKGHVIYYDIVRLLLTLYLILERCNILNVAYN